MTLATGTRLGPFEILAAAGVGGMGEVYRARDTRLDRTVAIKVLPAHLSSNPEFRQRFEREARTISSLQHPHICTLHDVGRTDGIDYLVFEYLEGETLADRLRRGPLPLNELLRIGTEISDALAVAHRRGIVHRDLKPGNILLTRSGAKLADFGLAKPAAAPLGPDAMTLGCGQPVTGEGTLLGTFEYMAPEQLQGKEADARSDIFGLGGILYEMTTGRRAFEGRSNASVLAAILEKEPEPIAHLQPASPPALDRTIRACLAKNPDERLQSAYDVGIQLRWIAQRDGDAPAVAPRGSRLLRASLLAVCVLAALALALTYIYISRGSQPERSLRAYVLPPENTKFVSSSVDAGAVAVSPDGSRIAFSVRDSAGHVALWVRPLGLLRAEPLAGTEGATYPFWSPDSRYLAFFADGKLKRIEVSGGPPQTLCDASSGRGGSWGPDGTILFAPTSAGPLERVPASGGISVGVTQLGSERGVRSHRWPQFLPDGHHFLYFAQGQNIGFVETEGIYVGDLMSKDHSLLLKTHVNAAYAPPGYLLYLREATLLAQPFEPARLQLTGEPRPIAEHVGTNWTISHAAFSASDNGVLVFHGGGVYAGHALAWFDLGGKLLANASEPGDYGWTRISPDGKRLAVQMTATVENGATDIWVFDLARSTRARLTFGPGASFSPAWSPDGTRIFYAAARSGSPHIYARASNGASSEELVYDGGDDERVRSISSDGRYLFFERVDSRVTAKSQIWVLPLVGERKPFPLVKSEFAETMPFVSPDGQWVAYESDESGHREVYLTSFPDAERRWQVSTGGGQAPRWRPDGRELFFLADDGHVMAVDVGRGEAGLSLGVARPLFQVSTVPAIYGPLDVSPDGTRFLVNTLTAGSGAEPATLVLNWFADVKK